MSEQPWQQNLIDLLTQEFDQDQLRVLCYNLGLDYERLGGETRGNKARALVEFCAQHDLGHQLARAMRAIHPKLKLSPDTVPGQARRTRVELGLNLDILTFGNQKRSRLVQDLARRLDVPSSEIYILTEASVMLQVKGKPKAGTQIVLGMPAPAAKALLTWHGDEWDEFAQEFRVQRIRRQRSGWYASLVSSPARRASGKILLLAYLASLVFVGVCSYLLAFLRHHGPASLTLIEYLYIGLGILPGLLIWIATPLIVTRFMTLIYNLGTFGEAFDYMFLLVFGPLVRPPYVFVQEGKVSPKSQSLPQARPEGPGGPCLFIVFNDSAVILERAGHRVGVIGPTVYEAGPFVKVHQVLDLRPQARDVTATVFTRDGIPVKTQIGVTFHIRWQGEPSTDKPYPADPDALFQAMNGQAVFVGAQREVRNWADRVGGNLDVILRNIVARYRLDELLAPPSIGSPPRSNTGLAFADRGPIRTDIERDLHNALKAMAANFGAEITEVRLGAFEFDEPKIKEQWMETWKAGWEGLAQIRKAKADAQAIRTREMAHAYAQLEMIAAITREFQRTTDNEAIRVDLVMLRFIEVIGRMVADPESAIFLPREALETLDGVRKMLGEAKETELQLQSPNEDSTSSISISGTDMASTKSTNTQSEVYHGPHPR